MSMLQHVTVFRATLILVVGGNIPENTCILVQWLSYRKATVLQCHSVRSLWAIQSEYCYMLPQDLKYLFLL